MVMLELATPRLQTQCSSHCAIHLRSYCWEGVEFIQLVYCIIIYLLSLNCDWLLIWEVQWFYWTQELLVAVEKFTVTILLWCSNSQPLDYKPSALAIELYSSKCFCWEGVEFIQLVYCIIIYLSFLNCDWLLIREVQWFYQTLEFPLQQGNLQWGHRWWHPNSKPLDKKPIALAIELYRPKAIAGKDLSLSSSCIASLYIYHFSTVIVFSSEKYCGSAGHRNSWYQ